MSLMSSLGFLRRGEYRLQISSQEDNYGETQRALERDLCLLLPRFHNICRVPGAAGVLCQWLVDVEVDEAETGGRQELLQAVDRIAALNNVTITTKALAAERVAATLSRVGGGRQGGGNTQPLRHRRPHVPVPAELMRLSGSPYDIPTIMPRTGRHRPSAQFERRLTTAGGPAPVQRLQPPSPSYQAASRAPRPSRRPPASECAARRRAVVFQG
ncbi:unnamed protein product [Vitrella brassicaformis CCMP3155]|uniref:Uncharacterized protein n=1 Tax=Vitrella brassicaformis (strain CCMP3155) TaxID=1169540 RepID=A0A0G4GPH8_VITBC|nr:unnamed protein product [Vitrella brassicaformis CCMP3155]|eukprot:CEM32264.1 unnamed protein product [Vitrella brassicaformis CCMP3155]